MSGRVSSLYESWSGGETDEYYVQVGFGITHSVARWLLECWVPYQLVLRVHLFWDSSVPELVYLGLLVVLFCGLLIGLARLAFCRTGFGGPSLLYRQFCPLGVNCWFWRVRPCWQQSWVHPGWTGGVGRFLRFWGFGVWLPCMLAWWGLLSLSGYDACLVIKPTRVPG